MNFRDKLILEANAYDFFVFDCDGVLLDSNELKTQSFRETLKDYPCDTVNKFISYHEENGGVSRYVKLDYFFRNILNRDDFNQEYQKTLERFSNISKKYLFQAKLVPSIEEFLQKILSLKKKCIVASGSNEIELIELLNHLKLDNYFSRIFGSPNTKKEILKCFLKENKHLKTGLFFGDAYNDYRAALNFGLDFIFVSFNSDWNIGSETLAKKSIKTIASFENIELI